MRRLRIAGAVVLTLGTVALGAGLRDTASAHSHEPKAGEEKAALSNDDKIASAVSAAPEAVSAEATVLDYPAEAGGDPPVLREGTNGWSCFPDIAGSPGNDPMCLDGPGMAWMDAYMGGTDPGLKTPGLGYMLQGGSDPSNTDPAATEPAKGDDWVTAGPHLMVFPAGALDSDAYGTDPGTGRPWVMWAGTPYEHLMVPTE